MTREEAIQYGNLMLSLEEDKESAMYDFIATVVKVLEQDQWIPVSERLPKDSVDVLATDGQLVFIAWYEDKDRTGWYSLDKFYNPYAPLLAWMPLPEPYNASPTVAEGE